MLACVSGGCAMRPSTREPPSCTRLEHAPACRFDACRGHEERGQSRAVVGVDLVQGADALGAVVIRLSRPASRTD
jgi:hypothetical protein